MLAWGLVLKLWACGNLSGAFLRYNRYAFLPKNFRLWASLLWAGIWLCECLCSTVDAGDLDGPFVARPQS